MHHQINNTVHLKYENELLLKFGHHMTDDVLDLVLLFLPCALVSTCGLSGAPQQHSPGSGSQVHDITCCCLSVFEPRFLSCATLRQSVCNYFHQQVFSSVSNRTMGTRLIGNTVARDPWCLVAAESLDFDSRVCEQIANFFILAGKSTGFLPAAGSAVDRPNVMPRL